MKLPRKLGAFRRSALRSTESRGDGTPIARSKPRRNAQESGYAFLMVLGLMLLMIATSLVAMQKGATIHRRQVEEQTIWRGNQYARAIRLYYHKTGHYPQTLDDLVKGMPDLHFLRQAYKNPTNSADGTWRFIYVNAAGQIIGSTRYANLQQMALMDANGGQLPTIPGQPGVPVSTLADSSANSGSQPPQNPMSGASTGNPNGSALGVAGSGAPGTDAYGNPPPDAQNLQSPNGQIPQNPQGTQNPQSPFANTFGQSGSPVGQTNPQGPAGLGQSGLSVDQATLAAMALLKPTGPVDGPVLGGLLTGVACTKDTASLKIYHGGKKYIDWEFIWNPLEDAAAAMQNQLGGATSTGLGAPGQGVSGALGTNPGASGPGTTSPFSNGPGGANPNPPNPPTPPQNNPYQQQPQQ
jgi:hypothetical protein